MCGLRLRAAVFAFEVLAVAGCATNSPMPFDSERLMHDEWFAYDASAPIPVVPVSDIFHLDGDVLSQLSGELKRRRTHTERIEYLLELVFDDDDQTFDYLSGDTLTASDAFRRRQGNCLSLAIMTSALAEHLGFTAILQEVKVPATWERRGAVDFRNRHVNVLIRRPVNVLPGGLTFSRDLVLDFDPLNSARNGGRYRSGQPLSRERVIAMFYNNLAAEAMARRDDTVAYANFRAAVKADKQFDATWINLSLLYRVKQQHVAAEQVLSQALQLNPESYAALRAMYRLLLDAERHGEAQAIASRLRNLREHDPYELYADAVLAMERGEIRTAIAVLEKVATLTSGFVEVHTALADAYAKAGDVAKAEAAARHAKDIARTINRSSPVIIQPPRRTETNPD